VSPAVVATACTMMVIAYFVLANLLQFLMAGAAALQLWRYQRRRTPRNRALVAKLASPPLVSIVVPARNEGLTIVESVRALLALDYEAREIVIVNDGSSDDTLSRL
jgi:peptidoglycan-N-acetylglucosamine deacetylase